MDEAQNENKALRHGFIYPVVCAFITALNYLNLVELFKAVGKRLSRDTDESVQYIRIAIDVFIILKWALVVFIWAAGVNSPLVTLFVGYLIATNIFTYFYRHIWEGPYDPSREGWRSRFYMLISSFVYNAVCYAYLYDVPFRSQFSVSNSISHTGSSALLSASRSVLVDFSSMSPVTSAAYVLSLSQTLIVFLFISVILSVSIPKSKNN